jgi:hypothetical protein
MSALARLALATAVLIGAASAASSAFAAPARSVSTVLTATSANWAGYAVTAPAGAPAASFSNVSGAWIQPAATCTAGMSTFSAFWVGIGGDSDTSQALEQVGTEADCSASGRITYRVWYELVPAAPVTIKLPLKPGDGIAASVAVSGKSVSVRITNVTQSRRTFAKRLTMTSPAPDLSSAEWVAEAPATCTRAGDCAVLPLADFGNVNFVVAKATASGHTGTISDPAWSATAITLAGDGASGPQQSFGTASLTATAAPTPLSADGSSFGVTWSEPPQSPPAQDAR